MTVKKHIAYPQEDFEAQKEYAKFILDSEQDANARMLKMRLSLESILQYLCQDNNISYTKPSEAIRILKNRQILELKDAYVYDIVRAFSNDYVHYHKRKRNVKIDLGLAVSSWKYVLSWFLLGYLAADNSAAKTEILESLSDEGKLPKIKDKTLPKPESAIPVNKIEKKANDVLLAKTESSQSQGKGADQVSLGANKKTKELSSKEIKSVKVEKIVDKTEHIKQNKPQVKNPKKVADSTIKISPQFHIVENEARKVNKKRYIVIFAILAVLVVTGVSLAYHSHKQGELLSPQTMIETEMNIHSQMWAFTNGINNNVQSTHEINQAEHWIEEADKILANIDQKIQEAQQADIQDNVLKKQYLDILQTEKESVSQTKQGVADTINGETYSEGFAKGTQADLKYDQLHEQFVNAYGQKAKE